MLLLDVAVGTAAALLLIPLAILTVEVVAAAWGSSPKAPPPGERPRIAVIIPAHDEEALIGATLRGILPQLLDDDRLVVVADNCSDRTAELAAAAGAEVIARSDPSRRGKGYALDFGIRHLQRNPPEVVLIIDADCQVASGTLDWLARACARSGRPVQALYLIQAPPESKPLLRIAEFACTLKNRVRALGLCRLNLPCHLMGTGMAFPWKVISRANLATGNLVEDLQLGLELAGSGSPPLFCPDARVTSFFPSSVDGFKTQRVRWEHGYLRVIATEGPRTIVKSLATLNWPLFALGLDVCIPPISLLCLLVATTWMVAAALYALIGLQIPFLVASLDATLLSTCIVLSWVRYGRRILSLGSLVLALGYALWKLPVYGRFLVSRQIDWVRSKRDADRTT